LPGQPFLHPFRLAREAREVITREEIRRRLWSSDTFVDFEHSLNSAIKKLRAALGDSPENSRYIETVPRMGYRFIAPVEQVSATANVGVLPLSLIAPPNRRPLWTGPSSSHGGSFSALLCTDRGSWCLLRMVSLSKPPAAAKVRSLAKSTSNDRESSR